MRGRKPNLKRIERVLDFKKMGLKNREIAREIGIDEKQVRRDLKSADKLSTV